MLQLTRKFACKLAPGRLRCPANFATVAHNVPHRRSARLASAAASAQMGSVKEITPPIVGTRKRRKINEKIQDTDNGHAAVEATTAVSEDVSVEIKDPVAEPPVVISPTKPKKRRAPKEEPVYIVPDVEKKETTFSGRLGYACLNTILRNKKPVDQSIFCSRTCRIDSLKKNSELAKELGRKNIEDLLTIIQWNEDNNIRFFRLSSEMFPYASHQTYGYSLDYCADILAKAGDLAKKYGHRLTTHPGQFTQLGSPKPGVVEAALRDLAYHCQMLDLMGMGPDSVMIIHGGGVYGDKPSTVERLKQAIRDLPINIRQRLVLENDEMCYNAEDLLPICEELDVPLVFDYHHHNIYPCSFSPATIIERTNAIFARRGIKPKQHLSEPRPGAVTVMERRAHADRCENLPPDLPDNMDLMIEAKDKEQAVLYLHRMYDLQPVNYKSLRPATENPSMHTQGRKSTKRARAKAANGPASDYE